MKLFHQPQRIITSFFLVLIFLALVMGGIRSFTPAHAASTPLASPTQPPSITPTLSTPVGDIPTPTQKIRPTATPPPSGDTTGIVSLSVILVVIIIFGVLWGSYALGVRKLKPLKPLKKGTKKTKETTKSRKE